ncbi:7865_t:CDS:2, partial [Funneliformis geosporum]
ASYFDNIVTLIKEIIFFMSDEAFTLILALCFGVYGEATTKGRQAL